MSNAISVLNTGSTVPDNLGFLTKLVCGKIARRRLPDLVKMAEITTAGATSLNLKTLLPDFFDFKLNVEESNKIIYSLDSSNNPTFYYLVSPAMFAENTQGGYAKREGNILTISVPTGEVVPSKLYFNYYSMFCWASSTGVAKEEPTNNDDVCILNSAFDDAIIEGILLYISRREKENNEYTKNVQEWEKRINEIIFYS